MTPFREYIERDLKRDRIRIRIEALILLCVWLSIGFAAFYAWRYL